MRGGLDVEMLQRACDISDRVMSGVRPAEFDAPTPCLQWTVRELMEHMVASTDFFADAAEDGAVAADRDWPEYEPSELVSVHRRHLRRLVAAYRVAGVMDRPMRILAGPSTAAFCIQVAISERYVHAWDLAAATGQRFTRDVDEDAIAEALLASTDYVAVNDQVRTNTPAPFGPVLSASPSAGPVERLMTFLGRDPHWAD